MKFANDNFELIECLNNARYDSIYFDLISPSTLCLMCNQKQTTMKQLGTTCSSIACHVMAIVFAG